MKILLIGLLAACLFAQSPVRVELSPVSMDAAGVSRSSFTLMDNNSGSRMATITPDGTVHIAKGFNSDQVIKRLVSVWQEQSAHLNDYHQKQMDACLAGWQKSNDDLTKFAASIQKALKK